MWTLPISFLPFLAILIWGAFINSGDTTPPSFTWVR
jgi:hypothetical protein